MNKLNFPRLVAICGRLGSDHEGERATAAGMATAILRENGLTWADVLADPLRQGEPEAPEPTPTGDIARDQLDDLVAIFDDLPSGRQKFVAGCNRQRRTLSPRQREVIDEIWHHYFGEVPQA